MSHTMDSTVSPALAGASAPASVSITRAGVLDTLAILGQVILPTVAKGVIIRRPAMVALAEYFDLDRRAVRRLQRTREKYGTDPLMLRIPGRDVAVILDPRDAHRVLAETPEPFATATTEKRAALAHFQPKGALISHGDERADRRRFNEEALGSDRPVHDLADSFLQVVRGEAARLREAVHRRGELTWDVFSDAWFRMVRRVVFGGAAADDERLSYLMERLRLAGNWAFLRPQRPDLRDELLHRIRGYLSRAEPGSLAGMMTRIRTTPQTAPEQQPPQWLFAFDPAGMTTFRSLALLAAHPEHARRGREEAATSSPHHLPFLRATVLESLRLWPTTPLVLRQTTVRTEWRNGAMPAGTAILIFAPYFHRDDERLPYADRFSPELWADGRTAGEWPLIPFSDGPAICPGRHLVLMLASAMLAELIRDAEVRLIPSTRLRADQPLPATLNNYGLRFQSRPQTHSTI